MIIKNHNIELNDTSASEMARFRQIMLHIWRQQIEDDRNAIEMEHFYKNNPYYCNNKNLDVFEDSDSISSGSDYEIDLHGNVTLKRKTKNKFDRLYKENNLIGKTNIGALEQLEGKNIVDSDFNEIKFQNRTDLNAFLDLTIKIQYAYDREVAALMVGTRTANLDDLRTKPFDLLLAGLKYSGKKVNKDGVLMWYSASLPKLMSGIGFSNSSTCILYNGKYYDIAGLYHTHPMGGPTPSGSDGSIKDYLGDLEIYKHYNLPGYIKTEIGWSLYGPNGNGKIQYQEGGEIYFLNINSEIKQ